MPNGNAAKVEYDGEEYAISGTAFVELEDKLTTIDKALLIPEQERELAKEWITYHTVFSEGHFVSKPAQPEPSLSEVFSEEGAETENDNINQPAAREPVWTQSRILAEKAKLLKKERELFEKEKKLFEKEKDGVRRARVKQAAGAQQSRFFLPNTVFAFLVLVVLIIVFIACAKSH